MNRDHKRETPIGSVSAFCRSTSVPDVAAPRYLVCGLLRCHFAALEAIAGAPREILYARMKTAVIGGGPGWSCHLQPRPSRPRAALRLPAPRLPTVSGQDQGQSRASVPMTAVARYLGDHGLDRSHELFVRQRRTRPMRVIGEDTSERLDVML